MAWKVLAGGKEMLRLGHLEDAEAMRAELLAWQRKARRKGSKSREAWAAIAIEEESE